MNAGGVVASVRESPVSSISGTLLTGLFLAGLISGDGMVDKTALILTSTVGQNFYIWNLITAGFLETNFLKLLLSLLWVATAGCKVEAMLGIESYAIFVNVVNFACGVVTSIGLFSLYVLTRFEIYLTVPTYGESKQNVPHPIHPLRGSPHTHRANKVSHLNECVRTNIPPPTFPLGFGGVVAALAVALKRYTPRDSPIPIVPSLKCHQLPMLLFCLSLAAWTLGIPSFSHDFPFVGCGAYVGWWYLRFVQQNTDGTFINRCAVSSAICGLLPAQVLTYSPFIP
jgi:hypothetical protein